MIFLKTTQLIENELLEEKSHGEIAELTKIPLGTVKSRIRLAWRKSAANWNKMELWLI